MLRSFASGLVVLSIIGCSSGAPPSDPPVTSPAANEALTPHVTVSPTLASRATPSVTTQPSAGIEAADALYILKDASFGVTGEIAIPIRNPGAGWVRIRAKRSRYTIYAHDGSVLDEKPFDWSYPSDLGPGDHGYLATQATFHGKAADVDHVTVELSTEPIDEVDVVTLTLEDLTNTDDPKQWGTEGVFTTGTVTNPTARILGGYDIGAFYVDSRGTFLGYSSLNPGILDAHETLRFATLPMVDGLKLSEIARFEVIGATWCDCPS
jgi:hypothetical protein